MACGATLSLKRAMALDPVQSPKRRRFGPAQPSASSPSSASPSGAAASASHHHSSSPMRRYLSVDPSPFAEVSPRVTAEQLVASIRQEFRRLQRRKHLDPAAFVCPACPPPSPPSPSPPPSPPSEQMEAGSPPPAPQSLHGDAGVVAVSPCLRSVPATAVLSASCPHRDPGPLLLTAPAPPTHHSSPLLTLRQVALICERAMREREDSLREEYEGVLTTKLSEQYDAFVKFNHDQMLRRYGERPASYVS